ncbi:hypothetical protein COCSUDRAFT_45602 [Coccomyxa subellipsoidea C-169]|uniref:Uncharacterized protein n=1 Tax=Coccomyxa subellipsoidea (strain C-169) TaxID=574566 RepID=I0YI38_COCSC|nr:hypothetical protein COCSUDRAFT_45602 [Coccomyxa subellipsoidea C-169]EIE18057.1 hypothetical protein COCSUDRAFT_45602 [Coccomyxa subellipsoidea C-169]|eukprot:XP_005642601.1 hypothetical protein COCSUDRAFT_45602 [Coccomyxa subellipsoidea C-169]
MGLHGCHLHKGNPHQHLTETSNQCEHALPLPGKDSCYSGAASRKAAILACDCRRYILNSSYPGPRTSTRKRLSAQAAGAGTIAAIHTTDRRPDSCYLTRWLIQKSSYPGSRINSSYSHHREEAWIAAIDAALAARNPPSPMRGLPLCDFPRGASRGRSRFKSSQRTHLDFADGRRHGSSSELGVRARFQPRFLQKQLFSSCGSQAGGRIAAIWSRLVK